MTVLIIFINLKIVLINHGNNFNPKTVIDNHDFNYLKKIETLITTWILHGKYTQVKDIILKHMSLKKNLIKKHYFCSKLLFGTYQVGDVPQFVINKLIMVIIINIWILILTLIVF